MFGKAVGLNPTEIFYSSGAGTGIPAGKNFVEHMRDEMKDSSFVVAIITPAYLESDFCLAELGAVWFAAEKDFYPICVPAIDRAELRATLTGTQVEKLDDAAALSDLLQRLCVHFEQPHVAAACTAEADAFLAALPDLLDGLAEPTSVPAERLREANEVNERLASEVAAARDENSTLQERYAELEAAKTVEEVAQLAPAGGVDAQIDQLMEAARETVRSLDHAVQKLVPYSIKGEGMPWPDLGDYAHTNVREAVDAGFLEDGGDGCVYLNEEWPNIEKALRAVNELQSTLRRLEGDEADWFRRKYEVPPDLRQGAVFDELL
jgi:hypothetical protein